MNKRRREIKFVKMLFEHPHQYREREITFLKAHEKSCSLPDTSLRALAAQGVLHIDCCGKIQALKEARYWLKRQQLLLVERQQKGNAPIKQSENDTIARLSKAGGKDKEPFLKPHHVVVAKKVAQLISRAHLRPNVTQNLSMLALPKASGGQTVKDISDFALDNRQELSALFDVMPNDCTRILFDVCGFEKGLQKIEFELGWPKRSAKLVLRMALDHAADFWSLSEVACG